MLRLERGVVMKYILKISSDDKVELIPYKDYHTIHECVDGYYERCGRIPSDEWSDGYDYSIWCNEEFLLSDKYEFNPLGSILSNQYIYGNVCLMLEGYNEDNEFDSLPMPEENAQKMKIALDETVASMKPIFDRMREQFNKEKPDPKAVVVSMTDEEFRKIFEDD